MNKLPFFKLLARVQTTNHILKQIVPNLYVGSKQLLYTRNNIEQLWKSTPILS